MRVGLDRAGIFRSVENMDVFPAACKDAFTAVRKMPARSSPSCG